MTGGVGNRLVESLPRLTERDSIVLRYRLYSMIIQRRQKNLLSAIVYLSIYVYLIKLITLLTRIQQVNLCRYYYMDRLVEILSIGSSPICLSERFSSSKFFTASFFFLFIYFIGMYLIIIVKVLSFLIVLVFNTFGADLFV